MLLLGRKSDFRYPKKPKISVFFGQGMHYHMGQFPQVGENGHIVAFFLELCCDQTVWFFSTFFNWSEEILTGAFEKCFRFGLSSSRTRARAVWSWRHWRWWWWWFVAPLSPKLQAVLARLLDELGPKRNHFYNLTGKISWGQLKKS